MPTIKELQSKAHSERRDILYRIMGYLAYFPAKILIYTPLTPNQVTILWIIGQLASALLLLSGTLKSMLLGLILFQAFFILDCTDGIMARYKKQFSLNGIYLDRVGHYVADPFLLLCYTWAVFKMYNDSIYLAFGGIAVIAFLLNKALTLNPAWYPLNQRDFITQSSEKSLLKNQPAFLYQVFAFFRLEYFFNFMFWGTLAGYAHYTLIIYSLFFTLELARKLMSQFIMNRRFDKELFESKS